MNPKLTLITNNEPVSRVRKRTVPKHESASEIAARIRRGKAPAKHRVFQPTEKREGDLVLGIGRSRA